MSRLSGSFRSAMRGMASGVSVVSTRSGDGHPHATTVSSVTSVSMQPPLLLVCLDRDSETLGAVRESRAFVVNVLGSGERELSVKLAGKGGRAKLEGIDLDSTRSGLPCLASGPAVIACRLESITEAGDHEIVLGRVTEVTIRERTAPLLYFDGGYHHLPTAGRVGPPSEELQVSAPAFPLGPERTIAIVGGGASGALTAIHALRNCRNPARIVIVEARDRVGRGPAYDTTRAVHRLNVPASQMGAYPDDPGHFISWVRRRDPTAEPSDFLPRSLFGDYLEYELERAEQEAADGVELEQVQDTVVAVRLDREGGAPCAELGLLGGGSLRASRVVLALGNLPPSAPAGIDPAALGDAYISDPWDQEAVGRLAGAESALLVGTGLTMVDVALTLGSSGGPALHAISRHGMLPRVHRGVGGGAPPEPFELPSGPISLNELVPTVIARCTTATQQGADWRDVVDSLRPHVPEIWRGLSDSDRAWFLSRLGRVWEIHRHRLAPEVAAALDRLRLMGRLRVRAGTVLDTTAGRSGVDVRIGHEGGREAEVIKVDAIVNCTGPSVALADAGDPLLDSLISAGEVRPGPQGIGLDVNERGRLYDAQGRPSPLLFTLGPNRRGVDWESTAIPEIRMQACELGRSLAESLDPSLRAPELSVD